MGDGKTSMDFIYIEDLARANVLGLKSDVSDEVFHIASGVETSLGELAATTMKVMGAPADMVPEYGPERKVNAVSRRLSSTEKAERLLGFKAEVSLEEGVRRFVKWWEANKDRFKLGRRQTGRPDGATSRNRKSVYMTSLALASKDAALFAQQAQAVDACLDKYIPAGRPVALLQFPYDFNVGNHMMWVAAVDYLKRRNALHRLRRPWLQFRPRRDEARQSATA